MIAEKQAVEKQEDVHRVVQQLFSHEPDWITFYREVLGAQGIVRQMFPTRELLSAFEKSEAYQDILRMLAKLRRQGTVAIENQETTRVITVRLPKSLHETLRIEAHEHRTSMNKLCVSKLLQAIDGEHVPAEI